MLHFEGGKEFPLATDELWARLRDPGFLVSCIPNVESVERSGPDESVFVLRPGFSFARGTLETTLRVVEAVPGQSVRLQVHSKAIGSTATVEATLNLIPQDSGTRVRWTTDIQQLTGLLKAVPQGLIKASAQKVIGDIWAGVEVGLQGPA
jgi:carbon monoxide dehydrogenase subunit G